MTEYKSEFEHTRNTPYLAITGELWGVFCEDFDGNWPRYNGTALYFWKQIQYKYGKGWWDTVWQFPLTPHTGPIGVLVVTTIENICQILNTQKNTHTSPLSSCYVVIVVCNMTEMTAFYSVSYDAAYIIKQGLNRTKCCLFKINIVALFDDV